jgi:hypothetical protein
MRMQPQCAGTCACWSAAVMAPLPGCSRPSHSCGSARHLQLQSCHLAQAMTCRARFSGVLISNTLGFGTMAACTPPSNALRMPPLWPWTLGVCAWRFPHSATRPPAPMLCPCCRRLWMAWRLMTAPPSSQHLQQQDRPQAQQVVVATTAFHALRDARPALASSRAANQFWYSTFSCTSGVQQQQQQPINWLSSCHLSQLALHCLKAAGWLGGWLKLLLFWEAPINPNHQPHSLSVVVVVVLLVLLLLLWADLVQLSSFLPFQLSACCL